MAAYRTEGVILRKYELRETSYILVAFTKDHGKIKGVIKGVRSPCPQFAGSFELFSQCDLLFYRKKKKPLDLITQCEAVEFFLPARKNIERLTYANYFIELIDVVTSDYDNNKTLYEVLVGSLGLLSAGASPLRVSRIFEIKLLDAIGLSPSLDECTKCGEKIDESGLFSVAEGGLICRECVQNNTPGIRLSLGAIKFLRLAQKSTFEKLAQIKVSREVGREIEGVLNKFIMFHINRPLRSLRFLDTIKKKGMVR